MTQSTSRRLLIASLALPLSLALAACGDTAEETAASPTGEPIAAIEAPEGQSWIEMNAETPEGGFRQGNPDAPIKLVEYASHTCSHCADFSADSAAAMEELISTGVVSYEIRNQIHDALDLTIAQLVRCSGPDAFHPLASQAWAALGDFANAAQQNQAQLQAAMQSQGDDRFVNIAAATGMLDFFAARGVSRDQARQCLNQPDEAREILTRSEEQSEELDVTGTPTFFINGSRIEGTSWEVVEAALQQAGAR
ncbi:protein-disulfide isomerase [Altererythrobacter atlanticus]|uniref:DSBA-like thioredoxin domain protein n=1 Tax=Croceibacterium atlanticum TaxID=1267766 RepID=A0A0F7KSN6_9SPHN|nr:thioredoxin domain-containing protein [Croceibacterium atlanticum]AKH42287.1 DSBA-like thioredoxin domain protein [Croceibacterium atlanticum]MBB5731064.1 protein-disulfide isomerase [Croceibacterium atlanticum]